MTVNFTTGEIVDVDLEQLTRERATITAQIDELTARKSAIDDLYREHLDFGTTPLAGLKVSIQHNRRLDPAKVMAAYPVTACPEIYKPTIDTTAIKKHIAPIDLEPFYVEGVAKVVVS